MAEQTGIWPELSADPVIQFCLIEALPVALRKQQADLQARADATEAALARAKAAVTSAVS